MSDVLTIDTGAGLNFEERIEPLPVYDENHPMLKKRIPEHEWPLPSPLMTTLTKRLKMTMKLYGGIGLSANQCGIQERVFIIGHEDFFMSCINPKVIDFGQESVKDNEGCLSYPGLYLKIERPKSIIVEFTTESGEVKQMSLDGITARCFLHELDHMNGKVFTDLVGKTSLMLAKQKQNKIMKKMIRNHKKKK